MPAMPRLSGRAKKIAYRILGVPANMAPRSTAQKRINRRLVFEETVRVR